jgi:hypothetical protein
MVSGSRACLTFILSDHPHRPSRHFDGALGVGEEPETAWHARGQDRLPSAFARPSNHPRPGTQARTLVDAERLASQTPSTDCGSLGAVNGRSRFSESCRGMASMCSHPTKRKAWRSLTSASASCLRRRCIRGPERSSETNVGSASTPGTPPPHDSCIEYKPGGCFGVGG